MRILIAYGTETYNAEGLAHDTAELLGERGFSSEVLDLEDFQEDVFNGLDVFLLITSTFGDGEPPSNAEDAYETIMSDDAPSMAGIGFSVCALGDTDYEHFCQCGKDFDKRLQELGGKRIARRVDCDTDFEEPWSEWVDSVLTGLESVKKGKPARRDRRSKASRAASAAPVHAAVDEKPSVTFGQSAPEIFLAPEVKKKSRSRTLGTRKNPYLTRVLSNQNLNHPFSEKETRHIVIALDADVVPYKVGDALGILPRNCPDLVRRILAAVGLSRETPVQYDDQWYPLRDVLMYKVDLTQIDRRMLKLASIGRRGGKVAAILNDRKLASEYTREHHLIDLLEETHCRPAPDDFVSALRPLAPRLYSIASSPNFHPNEVHLTVDVLRYSLHGSLRKGCASTFLGERAGEGVEVAVYVQPTKDFILCDDDVPMIMIGPGTGVAPFRAFLEEREYRDAPGQSWLFFGAQRSGRDFLYRDELLAWKESGRLVRLDTAFSRDQEEKIYVQDRLYAHRRSIYHWLESGAFIYVCGDAKRMARDVNEMLVRIVSEMKPCSTDAAFAYIQNLIAEKRYLKDVY